MANYILLERIELNASAASVTFANIPQTGYTDLKIVVSARTDNANNAVYLNTEFNGISTGYNARDLYGTGSAAASRSVPNSYSPLIPGSTSTANTFSNTEIYIPNYTSSTNKSYSADSATENNGTLAFLAFSAILWSNTAAITSIKLMPELGSLIAGSTFSLYGLAATGTTPAIAPKASGGNVIDYDGTYWIHTFNTNGTFTPQIGLTCDYLVVAGGGGGGSTYGGGGGAGGYRTSIGGSPLSLSATGYTVTVGAGGAGIASGQANSAGNGNNSVFSTITSTYGGGGGNDVSPRNGAAGGSGGGGAIATGGAGNLGGFSPVEGYAGGTGASPGNYGSGGGGGSSVVGTNGTTTTGGNGGAGTANSISGSSVTYAGGGGGGTFQGGTRGTGGAGGGGNAGAAGGNNVGIAGTVNTGGGGGGASYQSVSVNGGAGGSGIVIIRYLA
jgi:hypothetical protein